MQPPRLDRWELFECAPALGDRWRLIRCLSTEFDDQVGLEGEDPFRAELHIARSVAKDVVEPDVLDEAHRASRRDPQPGPGGPARPRLRTRRGLGVLRRLVGAPAR